MTFFTIFSIVVIALFITAMLAAAFFALKAVLTGDVSQLVALAEMTSLPGPEKMAQVVASMYQHVPKAFRAILTEERLEAIAQGIFNWMRKYAEEYISAIKKPEPEQEVKKISEEAIAETIAELLNMTAQALAERVRAYGIEVNPKATKKETAMEIIKAILQGKTAEA